MSMNKVKLSQIIRDFMITLDHDDYVSNVSDVAIRNMALRGIREIGFDIGEKLRSLKVSVESNDTITLPDDYVDVSKIGIIYKHLIPNSIGPVIVYATLTVPQIMLLEAFLSFLGLGVQAPLSSWGLLIRDGAVSMEEYWWLLIFPSLAFSLTLFSLNFIGDGLRDALDPRTADS